MTAMPNEEQLDVSRMQRPDEAESMSSDAKWLAALIVVLLFGPYLPHIPPIQGCFRADNLILPAVCVWMAIRAWRRRHFAFGKETAWYIAFYAWVLMITVKSVLFPGNQPLPSMTETLAAAEGYLRPLMMLWIAANVTIRESDLRKLARVVLICSIPLCLLGFLQLHPSTTRVVNEDFVYHLYRNERALWDARSAEGFRMLIKGGNRATSTFGQISNFGMFCLFAVGLLIVQAITKGLFKRQVWAWLCLAAVLLGGLACRSKVLTGGVIIVLPLSLIFTDLRRKFMRLRVLLAVFLLSGVIAYSGMALYSTGPSGRSRIVSEMEKWSRKFNPTVFWDEYLASRLGPRGKMWRTKALDVIDQHRFIGIGFIGMGHTTDAFQLGLVVLGGAVGFGLYWMMLICLMHRLYSVGWRSRSSFLKCMGRIFLFLTIAFLGASIGFHTFIQDRSGDLYWMFTGLLFSLYDAQNRPSACERQCA